MLSFVLPHLLKILPCFQCVAEDAERLDVVEQSLAAPAGDRRYMIRLPNVARFGVRDDSLAKGWELQEVRMQRLDDFKAALPSGGGGKCGTERLAVNVAVCTDALVNGSDSTTDC